MRGAFNSCHLDDSNSRSISEISGVLSDSIRQEFIDVDPGLIDVI